MQLDAANATIKKRAEELKSLQNDFRALKNRTAKRTKAGILNDIEQLEKTLDGLETQRDLLNRKLAAKILSEEQKKDIRAFAAEVRLNLPTFKDDFEGRWRVIEMLDLHVALKIEDGLQIAYVSCYLGNKRLEVRSNTITLDTTPKAVIIMTKLHQRK